MLAKIQLIGNLGQDPEIKTLQSGSKVASFSVATTFKNGENSETIWHKVEAWGKVVDVIEQYVKKGSKIYLDGRVADNSYMDKNQNRIVGTKVILEKLVLLSSNERKEDEVGKVAQNDPIPPQVQSMAPNSQPFTSDLEDDLPF